MPPLSTKAPPPSLPSIRRNLLRWYRRGQRDLPWRKWADDPYAQWLAEMMLQQTQAATVIPYYERFLTRFPTVSALADAAREEVLALWAGLGYYRRAHHLHDAARVVARELDGAFPTTVEGLRRLPGIGRYTAGAIASIAFDQRAPILDGNVRRVLARLFGIREQPDAPATLGRLWKLAEKVLPQKHCGAFNQGLMDLGALVCKPRIPTCNVCPLKNQCAAFREGAVDTIPPPRRQTRMVPVRMFAFIIHTDGAVLLRQRPAAGLWAGMWECPSLEANGDSVTVAAERLLPDSVQRRLTDVQPAGTVAHQLTHRAIRFEVFTARARRHRVPQPFRWTGWTSLPPLPRAFAKVLALAPDRPAAHNSRQGSGHS